MTDQTFVILQCTDQGCKFRFPVVVENSRNDVCPRCGKPTLERFPPFGNRMVRPSSVDQSDLRLSAILDNIRSAYNVGSIFRTADAAGLSHLYLCGMTATPKHPKVSKTALGAEKRVPWSSHNNSVDVAADLKTQGRQLTAIEGGDQSQWLQEFSRLEDKRHVTLIVGNELSGIDPELLEMCDQVLAIPMLGGKTSLNVTVAFGIAAYHVLSLLWPEGA
jgi:23S rRNA (guanosine2251-2'-O)-methyltransferase